MLPHTDTDFPTGAGIVVGVIDNLNLYMEQVRCEESGHWAVVGESTALNQRTPVQHRTDKEAAGNQHHHDLFTSRQVLVGCLKSLRDCLNRVCWRERWRNQIGIGGHAALSDKSPGMGKSGYRVQRGNRQLISSCGEYPRYGLAHGDRDRH